MYSKLRAACYELDRLREITRDENETLERLMARATSTGGSSYGDELPRGSHTGDKLERAAIDLAEYKTEIKKARRLRTPIRAAALSRIWRELDDGAAYVAEAIHDRGLNYKEIAAESGYSVRWVYLQDEKVRRV